MSGDRLRRLHAVREPRSDFRVPRNEAIAGGAVAVVEALRIVRFPQPMLEEASVYARSETGMIDPREFFNPANLQRLAGSAG